MRNRLQYDIDHDLGDVDFYWGVAAGSTHAALHDAWADGEAPEPERLMVNHATVNNQIWEGPKWFIDCGGSPDTVRANGGHKTSVGEYLEYLRDPPIKYRDDPEDVTVEYVALRDWPCEKPVRDALGVDVEELQRRTTRDHARMIDAVSGSGIDGEPVAVLQGQEPHEYLEHLDELRDHGLVTDTVGLGSVCRRNGDLDEVKDIAHRVRRSLPPRVDLHGFGLKKSMLDSPESFVAFDSVDSAAWEQPARWATKDGHTPAPPLPGHEYDDWIDWDDRGNPRYTGTNVQLCYLGYRQKVNGTRTVARETWGDDVTVENLHDWSGMMGRLDERGDDSDGYTLVKCICGTVFDPGRPKPMPSPGCRHCERAGINIFDKRLAMREA